MNGPLPYDKKYLIKCFLGLLGMMILMKTTTGSGFAIMLPLMLMAAMMRKAELLLYLLVITIAMMIGNNALMPKNYIFGLAQRASMVMVGGIMLLQIAGQRSHSLTKPFLMMILYLLFMVLSSSFGWCPFISYLKLFLFAMVFFACYGIANSVAQAHADNTRRVRSIFLSLSCFFIFGSIVLLRFPGIGQMQAEAYVDALRAGKELTSLFCGMTFHSQSLGPIVSLLGVALFADLVFGIRRLDKLYLALLLCIPVLLWKTSSRTAMGSFMAGIGVCVFFVMQARSLNRGWKMKILNFAFAAFVMVSVIVLVVPKARDKVTRFIVKYNTDVATSQMTAADVLMTRQGRWEGGIHNFKKSPMFGNGFQVSEDMMGLKPSLHVLSAPVEKSVWVSAVLEEGGVVGMMLFAIFLLSVIIRLKKRGAYMGLACFVDFLIINLGEFTMFSMSGIGGVSWAIVFIGVMMDARRLKERKMYQPVRQMPQAWGTMR